MVELDRYTIRPETPVGRRKDGKAGGHKENKDVEIGNFRSTFPRGRNRAAPAGRQMQRARRRVASVSGRRDGSSIREIWCIDVVNLAISSLLPVLEDFFY
jgi:hypothetical protein